MTFKIYRYRSQSACVPMAVLTLPFVALSQFDLTPPTQRKAPIAILVNGYNDQNLQEATIVEAKLMQMGVETPNADFMYVGWNNLYSQHGDYLGTDTHIINQISEYLSGKPADQPVILMGHSFGADSILKYLMTATGSTHPIDVVVSLDAVESGGARSTDHAIPPDVRYFYNRWQTNQTPGFVVPDVALINSISGYSGLPGITILQSDAYYNPVPIDSGSSGNLPSTARYTSQDTENTRHSADGTTQYRQYQFSYDIIGGLGGISTGYAYATAPLYNTHGTLPSDPRLQTEVVDLLEGIYNAYVNPTYTGDAWGTPMKPYHSVEQALAELNASPNHVDTIILAGGEQQFVENGELVIPSNVRVSTSTAPTTINNSSWGYHPSSGGSIQPPPDWIVKINGSRFGPYAPVGGQGGVKFDGAKSTIDGSYSPAGKTIVAGTDPAMMPVKTDQDVVFNGPTTINSLELGDNSDIQGSRVDVTLNGPSTLNFTYPTFLKANTTAVLNLSNNSAFPNGIHVPAFNSTEVRGRLFLNASGDLMIPELLSPTSPIQAVNPNFHIGGTANIHVGRLEWPGLWAPSLGSSDTTITIMNTAHIVSLSTINSHTIVYMAGIFRNEGTSTFGGPNPDYYFGIIPSFRTTSGNVEQATKLWFQNASGGTIRFVSNITCGRGIGSSQDLRFGNEAGAILSVEGYLSLGNFKFVNRGLTTISNGGQFHFSATDLQGNVGFSNQGEFAVEGGSAGIDRLLSDTYNDTGSSLTSSLLGGLWYVGTNGSLTLPGFIRNDARVILVGNAQFNSFLEVGTNGSLRLENGQVFSPSVYSGHEYFLNSGRIEMDASTFRGPTLVNDTSGTLLGTGRVESPLINLGTLSPGMSPGLLTVQGSYVQGATGNLAIEFAGTIAGAGVVFDQLVVTESATLGGTLSLSALGPLSSDVNILIVDANSLTGNFSDLPVIGQQIGYGVRFGGITYDAANGNVTVSLLAGIPGDYNGDGFVDAADYVVGRKGLGAEYLAAGYDTWRSHFGQTAGAGASLDEDTSIPEPSLTCLLGSLGVIFGLRRSQRRNCKVLPCL